MIRRPPRSTLSSSSAASDVYKRQLLRQDRCLQLRQDRCLLLRLGGAQSEYYTSVLSQQQTSVLSQQQTSVLSQQQTSASAFITQHQHSASTIRLHHGFRQPKGNFSNRPHPPAQTRDTILMGRAVWRVTEKPKIGIFGPGPVLAKPPFGIGRPIPTSQNSQLAKARRVPHDWA